MKEASKQTNKQTNKQNKQSKKKWPNEKISISRGYPFFEKDAKTVIRCLENRKWDSKDQDVQISSHLITLAGQSTILF